MILCAGEALIDMLPRTATTGENALHPAAGGAVFNTAIALGRLGVPTSFFSGLSDDMFGRQLVEALNASGVATDLAAFSDRPTTLAFVELVKGQARYTFYDENTAGRMLQTTDLPTDLSQVDALFFGGISLVFDPCGAAYEALLKAGSQAGKLVMLDPNIRPGFIKDEGAYRARLDRMITASDIVKLSDEDLHWLMGPGSLDALAAKVLNKGPSLFCLTEGAKGVTAYWGQHKCSVAASRVAVVDTVGAGDTFNAGFLAGLDQAGCLGNRVLGNRALDNRVLDNRVLGKPDLGAIHKDQIEAALTLGVRAAAVTVSRAGANPPWAKELEG
ncbi:MAG: fructokinase [Paracoccaceae bacterium]|jgi:fructokinase